MLKKLVASLALSLLSATAAQAGVLYAMRDSGNTLVSIDTTTLALTVVGATGVGAGDFGGMAYDPNSDKLYWVPGRGNNNLYTLNRTTGAATLVGTHGVNDLFGLEFDISTGTLYGSQFAGGNGLYRLNTGTGAATTVNASMGVGIGGLAYDSTRDRLVGVADGSGTLYNIDRSTGATTLLANPGSNNDSGLAYDGDTDQFWDIDWSGNLFSIDIGAGYARTTRLTGLGPMDGLAYVGAPTTNVPEPTSLALVGLGLIGAASLRRKQVVRG